MPEYLCEGGSVSCGGPRCLSILEERQKKAARKEALEGLKDESLDYLKNLYFSSEIIENSSSSSKETPGSQEKAAQDKMAQDNKALEEKKLCVTPSVCDEPRKLEEISTDKKQEKQSTKGVAIEPVGIEKSSLLSSASDQQVLVELLREKFPDPSIKIEKPKEKCLADVESLKAGNKVAKLVTQALCADAMISALDPRKTDRVKVSTAGCAAGMIGTSVCEFASDKWKEHCDTLPDVTITFPPASNGNGLQ